MKTMLTTRPIWVLLLLAFCCFGLRSYADTEPNDNLATAEDATFGATVTGTLNQAPVGDLNDYYLIVAPDDGSITVTADIGAGLNAYVHIYDKTGGGNVQGYVAGGNSISVIKHCMAADTFVVRIHHYQGAGSYSFTTSVAGTSMAYDAEDNGSITNASQFINAGESVEGHIGYYDTDTGYDEHDYFGAILPEDGSYTFRAIRDPGLSGEEFYLRMKRKDGAEVGNVFTYSDTIYVTVDCLAADTVYLNVDRYSGCGGYTLSFENTTPAGTAIDEEDNSSIANVTQFIGDGEEVTGHIGYYDVDLGYDDHDYFGVILPEDGSYTFRAIRDAGKTSEQFYLRVKGKNGTEYNSGFTNGDTVLVTVDCLAADTVYMNVDRYLGCGGYTLSFENTTPPGTAIDNEDNSSIANVTQFISEGEEVTGHIGYYDTDLGFDEHDYFGVILPRDGTYTFRAIRDAGKSSEQFYLRVKLKNGSEQQNGFTNSDTVLVTVSCLAADTVYMNVDRYLGCGGYTLSFDAPDLTYANDTAPNESISEAALVPTSSVNYGHLGYYDVDTGTDGFDFYKFTVVQVPFELDIKLETAESLNAYLRLYNSAGSNIQTEYYTPGSHNFTYTITTAGEYFVALDHYTGCGSYSLGNFCANAPEVAISADGPTDICPGESVTLTATAGLDAYKWFKDGIEVGDGSTFVATEPGTYFAAGYDVNGCDGISEEIEIGVFGVPDVSITTEDETTFCEGGSITLTATAGFDSYEWSNGATGQSIEVSESGTYSVTATTADGCDKVSSNSIEVTVQADSDGDGVCDVDDSCPSLPGQIGDTCDDGNPNTENDVITADCECVGTPVSIYDCPDEEQNIGDACDDGNPYTENDTRQEDCSCAGTPLTENTVAQCSDGIDNDGNGLIDCYDPGCQAVADQIGCIPCLSDGLSFADSVLAYETVCTNIDPDATNPEAALGMPDYNGQSSQHATLGRGYIKLAFTNNTLVNSGTPASDLYVFEVGPLVESSFIELRPVDAATEAILINEGILDSDNDGFYEFGGIGGATAAVDIDAFFNNLPANSVFFDAIKITDAPGNCATDTPGADIDAVCALSSAPCAVGASCDDGDPLTENDVIGADCNCSGTPIVYECPDLSANIGDSCDDGDASTENDVVTEECGCEGTPIITYDCPELEANIGDACDDGDASTENDVVTEECGCEGTPIITYDCPELEANIGDACDDGDASTENDVVTEECGCEGTPIITYDCPELEANIGDACNDENPNTINDMVTADCGCEGTSVVPGDCVDFVTYLADFSAGMGTDIYKVELSGGDAVLSFIANTPDEVHIAYNNGDNLIYAVSKTKNEYSTLNPHVASPVFSAPVSLGGNYGEITGAEFFDEFKLLIASQNTDKIFGVNILNNAVSEYDGNASVFGGDMARRSDGMLYLSTNAFGGALYEVYPDGVMPDVYIAGLSGVNTGMAITDADQLLLSTKGSSMLKLLNTDGSTAGNYPLVLNGETFTAHYGDMASGCNTYSAPNPGECDNFSTFYAQYERNTNATDIYSVNFSGSEALLTAVISVPFEVHIAFDANSELLYLVSKTGSFIRTYNTGTMSYLPDVTLSVPLYSVTAAEFNPGDGMLYIGDANTDDVYMVDPSSGMATLYGSAPIHGGDLGVLNNGSLYLATQSGNALYDLSDSNSPTFAGVIPAGVTGMARANVAGGFMLSNYQSNVFTGINATDGSVTGAWSAMLNGVPFTLMYGDMASGCADGDVEEALAGRSDAPLGESAASQNNVRDKIALPGMLTASPNPTSGHAKVAFSVPVSGKTRVEVYDMNGRNVTTLFDREAMAGQIYTLDFDGSYLPNGVYIYRMTTDSETIIEKFMIAK